MQIWDSPFIAILLLLAGGISVGGAALNLDVFMNSPKAEPFVKGLGRTGARIFYIVLGLLLAGFGVTLLIID